jgi:hypothetical protein
MQDATNPTMGGQGDPRFSIQSRKYRTALKTQSDQRIRFSHQRPAIQCAGINIFTFQIFLKSNFQWRFVVFCWVTNQEWLYYGCLGWQNQEEFTEKWKFETWGRGTEGKRRNVS